MPDVSPSRSYSEVAFDTTYQHISKRPVVENEVNEVVYATDPEPTVDRAIEQSRAGGLFDNK